MGDFGTGLLAHLERARDVLPASDGTAPPPAAGALPDEIEAERRRLEARAAELAGRELALVQREAELEAARERLALDLARALLAAAESAGVPPPLDELAVVRARRVGG